MTQTYLSRQATIAPCASRVASAARPASFKSRYRKLAFAPFLARLDDADVPGLILGMDGAKPPSADAAVGRCGRIAGLSYGRNGVTGPFEVSGTGVIELLQHIPSSCGQ